jgi:predicted DNA-binding transcriptional regulator YafY
MEARHEQVLSMIQGSEKPVKRKEIARRLSISERTVTAIVSDLRKNMEPILNDLSGFYYSRDPAKIVHSASILESQANDMLNTARSLRSLANRDGQMILV